MPHATLKTATGITVSHSLKYSGSEYTDAEKQQKQQQYLNDYPGITPTYYTKLDLTKVELLPTKEYNCWGFTFDPRRCVINSPTDVENILNDNANPVPDGSVKIGDVICYRNYGVIQHTGRVWEVDNQGHATLIRSKWGGLGEYLHPPLVAPPSYGTDITYWRIHTHLEGRAVLVIKDSNLDTGFQSSPTPPFGVSPDIWVDNDLDGNPDPNPIPNQTNHVYARVRNNGTVAISNIETRFYWADPSGGFSPSDWNLIGTITLPSIAANSEAIAGPVSWTPQPAPTDPCLLVIANGGDGIIDNYEPDPIVYPFNVRWENCIALKIVHLLRDPIDIEMVMDVSNSMNSPSPSDPNGDTKLTMMKQATTMIIDFLNDHSQANDRMGLIWFTDDASEYQNTSGQKLLPIQANWADLRAEINAHGTGTCTAMGAGLQKAFDTLPSSTQKRFTVLCTDGMQNIEPKVAKVGNHYEIIDSDGWLCGGHSSIPPHPGVNITSYNTSIHTIGIGITATYASLLQEIANETNGFYRGTNDPENDLDLIYFLDLCSCLSGGSPGIIHHSVSSLSPRECEAVESFFLNRSISKITVMLSWKKSQGSNLTFWLYSPDGSLVDLHQEMKLFENHCLATIDLPKKQNGNELTHVGQWHIIIRGETHQFPADYHLFVIGDDPQVKYQLDFPRKLYEVGDLLPIKITLTESKKPILKPKEIIMETAHLSVPLADLLAKYEKTSYELRQITNVRACEYQRDPLALKIEAMASDPQFSERLKPLRDRLSLRKGDLECKIWERDIIIPVVLKKSGLHSFKVKVQCETPENGPIYRTDMISVNVGPGKVDPKLTRVTFVEVSTDKKKGVLVDVTPRTEKGQLLGPGLGYEIKAIVGKKESEIEVEDQLDGTYRIILSQPKKEKPIPVEITFRGKPLWKGSL